MAKIYDYSRLLGKMREKNISQEQMASAIGISSSTMNIKLKNKSEFGQGQMIDILNVLGVPLSEISSYFFCSKTFENAS